VAVIGEDAPVKVAPPGVAVNVKEVAVAPVAAGVKDTLTEPPALYAIPEPTFVAVPIVGAFGGVRREEGTPGNLIRQGLLLPTSYLH
jgi:hypothetical protein